MNTFQIWKVFFYIFICRFKFLLYICNHKTRVVVHKRKRSGSSVG